MVRMKLIPLLKISDLGGMSSAGGLGAIEGFSQALVTAYAIYKPANINPGKLQLQKVLKVIIVQ